MILKLRISSFFTDISKATILNVNNSSTKSCSSIDEAGLRTKCEQSKSAASILQGVQTEVLPAVPPRRASLGILNRTNCNKGDGKTSFKISKEFEKEPNSSSSNLSEKIDEECEVVISTDDTKHVSDKVEYSCLEEEEDKKYTSLHREQSTLQISNSKFYISSESEGSGKAIVKLSMRERLKQLAEPVDEQDNESSNSKDSLHDDSETNSEVDNIIKSLRDYTHNGDESGLENRTSSDSEKKLDVVPEVKVTSEGNNNVPIKPGDTDTLGYTKLWYGQETKNSDQVNSVETTANSPQRPGACTSYLPSELIVLSHCKVDSDSSGCSSLENTSPMRGSWVCTLLCMNNSFIRAFSKMLLGVQSWPFEICLHVAITA